MKNRRHLPLCDPMVGLMRFNLNDYLIYTLLIYDALCGTICPNLVSVTPSSQQERGKQIHTVRILHSEIHLFSGGRFDAANKLAQ